MNTLPCVVQKMFCLFPKVQIFVFYGRETLYPSTETRNKKSLTVNCDCFIALLFDVLGGLLVALWDDFSVQIFIFSILTITTRIACKRSCRPNNLIPWWLFRRCFENLFVWFLFLLLCCCCFFQFNFLVRSFLVNCDGFLQL